MVTTARIIETLGGARVVRPRGENAAAELSARVRAGLPYASLEAVAARFQLAVSEVVQVLHLPPRTLARRKKERRLGADESDRLVRLGRVATLAEDILGNAEKAARWLHRPNRALGHKTPLQELDTEVGAREVENVLLRIAHGVYS